MCAFFARPNLDNIQFKQLEGSVLTLSGQTQIATTSGLTLYGGVTGGTPYYIPIIATGASNNFVLTYDGAEDVIKLKESTASGATGVYPYNESATTTVGGLLAGQNLYNEQVVDILHDILVPILNPTLTTPSISSFVIYSGGTLNTLSTIFEVGKNINVDGCTCFNPGSINPVYPPTACSCRSDGTGCYIYNSFGIPYCCVTNSPSNCYPFGSNIIIAGSNIISSTVCYSGGTQPYDSSGSPYSSPLSAGTTSTCSKIICGVYPWFWGIVASGGAPAGSNRPTTTCIKSLITGGTANKCIEISTSSIDTTFNSTSDDYLWFATPVASTTKTCWYIDALNKGSIGGGISPGCNLFPTPVTLTGVTTSCWTGQSYRIYISNYQSTSAALMELRNS